ncbi:hypothetical protein SAMN05444166_6526 [Singulisphaera sp. GP187]|uniref:hypothetical protein n=1 Tax=Singulisphaera sp. GP187 TaxID=1882752 RepID=UPI0009290969|nr:hypothetical protein [Singulisphaera sp. GP187]SIO60795.1 hypothetical protein SAMN05444166_6526 [Singulisphaera sp. GP187]
MFRVVLLLAVSIPLTAIVARSDAGAAEPQAAVRGVLVRPGRVTPEFLAAWKAKGASAVVVPLDEVTKQRWETIAKSVERAGMTLWPWVEVARNPAMADAHPDWMAAPGGHHDDWRRRFPTAPTAKPGEVIKAWPWVPIGYAPAFDAHRERLRALLGDLPGAWSGAFLNDLQAGPSSCGCGNDQCRWALDYGTPSTAAKTPGDDAAARVVAEVVGRHPGKTIVPVWVTECETADLANAKGGTGLCGGVPCAKGDCWPRYVRNWNPLVKATGGPIALGLWPEVFRRDPAHWIETDLILFQQPPRGGTALGPERTIAVIQAWGKPEATVDAILERVNRSGWVLALDPIEQSWEPRAVPVP